MSCVELVRRQSFMGDGHIGRGTGISRNEPYWDCGNVCVTKTSRLGNHNHVILRLSHPEP